MFELFIAFGAGLNKFFISMCVTVNTWVYFLYFRKFFKRISRKKKHVNLAPIILFTLGFSTVFIIFGAASTFLGQVLLQNSYELRIAAGLVIVISFIAYYWINKFKIFKL